MYICPSLSVLRIVDFRTRLNSTSTSIHRGHR